MPIDLLPHQQEALRQLSPGKILYGNVGTGKSLTALQFYVETQAPKSLIVVTTAKKRDSLEWLSEAAKLGVGSTSPRTQPESPPSSIGKPNLPTIDSWNNIGKYVDVKDAFFIFDEQRLVGHGVWVKSFLKIAKNNDWIMLTATPGDNWLDYVPVFIANGWYKNRTEFVRRHVVYHPFLRFPKIKGYLEERHLEHLRNEILVEAPYVKHTIRHLNWIDVGYDKEAVKKALRDRWNPFTDEPMADVAELWRVMRQLVNTDPSRLSKVCDLMKCHPRLIIFYNFNYELRLLRSLGEGIEVAEWNGQRKNPLPESDTWLYLVQYTAGGEGWNCTSTNAMTLYSLPYSYKAFVQCMGRIDRLNTPYTDLYYYILKSSAPVDYAVKAALDRKRDFNAREANRVVDRLSRGSDRVPVPGAS